MIQRDLQVSAIIGDLYAGRPVAYTTFLAYDEVAHHSGIERPDALSVLRKIDRQFARIEQAAKGAPRPYHLVVLSDHGQSQGATFLDGAHYLDEDRMEGEDPLAPFGPNAPRHVKRADGFEHVADVMVNSTYYAEMDEVAAFEELVGSHGGMGGSQSFPFVVLPTGWRLPEQAIVGPDHMHQYMRRWLADLGHEQYQDASPEEWSG